MIGVVLLEGLNQRRSQSWWSFLPNGAASVVAVVWQNTWSFRIRFPFNAPTFQLRVFFPAKYPSIGQMASERVHF